MKWKVELISENVFLSTLSLRRATYCSQKTQEESTIFLSTLSLRRATQRSASSLPSMSISIHALLAESDSGYFRFPRLDAISIHALLAESDVSCMLYDTSSLIFLSTLSLRRATLRVLDGSKSSIISIHALLAESDSSSDSWQSSFQ